MTDVRQEAHFCQACVVRSRAICADLDQDEIQALNSIGRRRNLIAGEQLLREGDEAIIVANVVQGVLKLSTQTSDGKEQILGLVYPSDFVGRPFNQVTPYGVQAVTQAEVCIFQRTDFDRFAREHPRLEHKLLERTLKELDRTRRWMLLLGRMTAEQKLASFLLETAERAEPIGCSATSSPKPPCITMPLSRQQIADVLGLSIETVSRLFSKMKMEGLIDLQSRRQVAILRPAELAARAG